MKSESFARRLSQTRNAVISDCIKYETEHSVAPLAFVGANSACTQDVQHEEVEAMNNKNNDRALEIFFEYF